MKLWNVIGTFVVIIQLINSLPVEQNECEEKKKLCGDEYIYFVQELCGMSEYSDCPVEDDKSIPKFEHKWQIKDHCCETGCKVGYLKWFICQNIIEFTTKKYTPRDHKFSLRDFQNLFRRHRFS